MSCFCADGKILVRINLPLFSTVVPSGTTVENKDTLILNVSCCLLGQLLISQDESTKKAKKVSDLPSAADSVCPAFWLVAGWIKQMSNRFTSTMELEVRTERSESMEVCSIHHWRLGLKGQEVWKFVPFITA